MNKSNIFSICDQTSQIVSSYIPLLSFSTQENCNIAESYISKEAELFFSDMLQIDEPIQMIPYFKTISFKDFNVVPIEYFYNNLFFDLGERDSNKKLIRKLKWGITFDEELTPIESNYPFIKNSEGRNCPLDYKSRGLPRPRNYGYISINGEPIFYYLHFTLQEILDAIKSAN